MNSKFSERLVELRKQEKISQRDLARAIEVSKAAVSLWERGERTPDINTLLFYRKLFKVYDGLPFRKKQLTAHGKTKITFAERI